MGFDFNNVPLEKHRHTFFKVCRDYEAGFDWFSEFDKNQEHRKDVLAFVDKIDLSSFDSLTKTLADGYLTGVRTQRACQSNHAIADKMVEAYRALGFDYAVHGLQLGSYLDVGHDPRMVQELKAEYELTKKTTSKRIESTPYVRKLLLLRQNALKRKRFVDSELYPEHIELLTSPVCPISGRVMSFGGESNDFSWSVDRLNNDVGYTYGNLAVMCQYVNKAKDRLGFLDILQRAKGVIEDPKLTRIEWFRLACLSAGSYSISNPELEFLSLPMLSFYMGNSKPVFQKLAMVLCILTKVAIEEEVKISSACNKTTRLLVQLHDDTFGLSKAEFDYFIAYTIKKIANSVMNIDARVCVPMDFMCDPKIHKLMIRLASSRSVRSFMSKIASDYHFDLITGLSKNTVAREGSASTRGFVSA